MDILAQCSSIQIALHAATLLTLWLDLHWGLLLAISLAHIIAHMDLISFLLFVQPITSKWVVVDSLGAWLISLWAEIISRRGTARAMRDGTVVLVVCAAIVLAAKFRSRKFPKGA